PPGFSLLIAALVALGCDATWASWSIGVVGYGVFVALFVRLTQRSLGNPTAWVTGALLTMSPRLWAVATEGLSDIPFLIVITLAVIAVGVRSSAWRIALLAAAMAAAVYVRYVGIFLFPAVIAAALVARTRLTLRQALLACSAGGLAILPLLWRNFVV